jgi:phosphatidylinositol alpha-1,6-mannosyltransferase
MPARQNKHILLFSSEFPPGPGGIGTHAYQIASHLEKFGWKLRVVTSQDYTTKMEVTSFNSRQEFAIYSLPRTGLMYKDIFVRIGILCNHIKEWKPSLLIVTGDRLVWLVALIQVWANFFSSDLVLPWWAVWYGVISPKYFVRQITNWAFGHADLIITISQYSLKKMLEMGVRPRCSKVITLGADENSYFPDLESGLSLRKSLGLVDAQILLTVGHVSERKGHDIVIRALPTLLQGKTNLHYLIVGIPTIRPSLEKLAEELGVSKHVHFLGCVPKKQLNSLYNACDVFVLTSRHSSNGEFEGFGIVVVEAALCAKPAVVANNSGLAEVVVHERTGFIVMENDSQETGQVIKKLLANPVLLHQMGQAARQHALAEQTWQFCIEQYHNLLVDI